MRRNQRLCCLTLVLLLLVSVPSAFAEEGRVQGTVWHDDTPDGLMNDEACVPGAVIVLEKMAGEGGITETARTESDENGFYSLTVPETGTYRLRVELPADYLVFSLFGQDSSVLPIQGSIGFTRYFETAGGENKTMNIGASKSSGATVTIVVYNDANGNGSRASGEKLLSNVRVGLLYEYEGETWTVAELTPSFVTKYGIRLKFLSPGTYRAYFEVPKGYRVGPMGSKFSGWYSCFTQEGDMAYTVPFTVGLRDNQYIGAGVMKIRK
jgi:hypothetical protein